MNNCVNIKFHNLKICANDSPPFKYVICNLSESQNDFEISVVSQFFWSLQFPHLELFKADFDLENIKQSWLSGQNIGLYAPSTWFKPQQHLWKKKDIFMHLREVYYYIYILVSTHNLKSGVFTFYNFYNFWKVAFLKL